MGSRTKAGAGRPPRPKAGRSLDLVPDLAWSLLVEGSRAERRDDDDVRGEQRGRAWGPEAWTQRGEAASASYTRELLERMAGAAAMG